ncbi:MAG TPA: hypothetical protein VFW66_01400 [Gemmatimonadales bacterium]|nr:hypothetical protein [Gemmatimonadales bacterium]
MGRLVAMRGKAIEREPATVHWWPRHDGDAAHIDWPVGRRMQIAMTSSRAAALAAGALSLLSAAPARAQLDYRNLDDDRPTLIEDAYPVERYAFEFLAPYRYEHEVDGADLHLTVPELEYGFMPNAEAGIRVPFAAVRVAGNTDWGVAGTKGFVLYNLNTEGATLPALSLRTDVSLPVGSLAGDDVRASLKLIATRSWGRNRIHVNVSRGFGSEDGLARVEAIDRWTYGAALDRTLFRQSILALAEVYGRQPVASAPTEINASLGARYQLGTSTVLDAGLSRRLRSSIGPDIALTFGFSWAFAMTGFMPGAQ